MKKFLLKTVIFLLGRVILSHGLAAIADRLSPNHNTMALWNDQKHMREMLSRSSEIEALAIGNSHMGCLQFERLGYRGHRFARSAGDLFEIRYHLEQLIPRMKAVQTVFFSISYGSFHEDNAASDEVNIRRADVYTSLPSWQFIDGDFGNFVRGKTRLLIPFTSLLRKDNWQGVFYALLGKTGKTEQFVEIAQDDCSYMETEEWIDHAKTNRVAKLVRLQKQMLASRPDLVNNTYNTLVSTIRFLRQRGIRTVFFTPPYPKMYTDCFRSCLPETLATMKSRMRRLQQTENIEYYDLSQDDEFVTERRLFKDSDHLNGCGARIFSMRFKRLIAETEPTMSVHK